MYVCCWYTQVPNSLNSDRIQFISHVGWNGLYVISVNSTKYSLYVFASRMLDILISVVCQLILEYVCIFLCMQENYRCIIPNPILKAWLDGHRIGFKSRFGIHRQFVFVKWTTSKWFLINFIQKDIRLGFNN